MVYISILLILKQDRLAKNKNPQRRSLSVISVLLRIQMYSHIQESGHRYRFADKLLVFGYFKKRARGGSKV